MESDKQKAALEEFTSTILGGIPYTKCIPTITRISKSDEDGLINVTLNFTETQREYLEANYDK